MLLPFSLSNSSVPNAMAAILLPLRGFFAYILLASIVAWKMEAWSSATEASDVQRPVVLLTGDSLTEQGVDPRKDGWVTLLQYQYTRSTDIVVRGLSGYNTRWFLNDVMPALEREIKSGVYIPTLITVWLGANDAALVNGSNFEMHVPIANYTENLVSIVTMFQATAPDAKVLLITPPHIDDTARAKYAAERNDTNKGLIDRSNAMAGDYSRACVDAGSRVGVPVLDLHTYFNAMPESSRNALLADGLHFNAAGHKIVDEQFQAKIESEFPDVVAKLQLWQFPAASQWVNEDPYIAEKSTAR